VFYTIYYEAPKMHPDLKVNILYNWVRIQSLEMPGISAFHGTTGVIDQFEISPVVEQMRCEWKIHA
jgi:hypothetical protein